MTDNVVHSDRWGTGPRSAQQPRLTDRQTQTAAKADAFKNAELEREAHQKWRMGLVIPLHITVALDMAGLLGQPIDGPEVDIACGAVEPAVDEWERGTRYPTWEQIKLLAEYTSRPVWWFMAPIRALSPIQTSLRFHVKRSDEPLRMPVHRYTYAALLRARSYGVTAVLT